ncbi:hypothetical protein C5N14_24260 [Micromonospora sp. MW-13]|nr:hypothetical protein C5N14_24260 [Micromonospora sp. MW-13]
MPETGGAETGGAETGGRGGAETGGGVHSRASGLLGNCRGITGC